jgi:hypothetical protein
MLFDLEETPILETLTINGRLTFANTSTAGNNNLHLRAEHIFIRAGELRIGTPDAPYTSNA